MLEDTATAEFMVTQPPRSERLMSIVKPLVNFLVDHTTYLHVDMPQNTREFLAEHHGTMIISRHVGLAETVIMPTIFYKNNLSIPYMVIGDNLVKGKFFVKWSTKLGMVFSERGNRDIEEAAENSRCKMKSVLEAGNYLGLYPTPGRSKNGLTVAFQSSPFQAAIEIDSPIVPVSPGYFQYPEEDYFVGRRHSRRNPSKTEQIKGYTVKILHVPKLVFKHKGDVYMNFGDPIIPSQVSDDSRELADYVRKACLYLTPITERNIVAFAMEKPGNTRDNIKSTLERIQPYSDRFVFKIMDDIPFDSIPLEDKVDILSFRADVENKHPKLRKMYANEIKHYVEGMYGRKYDK